MVDIENFRHVRSVVASIDEADKFLEQAEEALRLIKALGELDQRRTATAAGHGPPGSPSNAINKPAPAHDDDTSSSRSITPPPTISLLANTTASIPDILAQHTNLPPETRAHYVNLLAEDGVTCAESLVEWRYRPEDLLRLGVKKADVEVILKTIQTITAPRQRRKPYSRSDSPAPVPKVDPQVRQALVSHLNALADNQDKAELPSLLISKLGLSPTSKPSRRILMALTAFPKDREVQYHSCKALANLAKASEDRKMLGRSGAPERVVSAMSSFPMDRAMQHVGCRVVANLAKSNADNKRILFKDGAAEVVMAAMANFAHDRDIQHVGCGAVANLTHNDAVNKRVLATAGACEKVVGAMRAFGEDKDVQWAGCWALVNLYAAGSRAVLEGVGALETVVMAMKAFAQEKNVQHYGCMAVAKLVVNGLNTSTNQASPVREVVESAMQTFPSHKEIHENGALALKSLGGGGGGDTDVHT